MAILRKEKSGRGGKGLCHAEEKEIMIKARTGFKKRNLQVRKSFTFQREFRVSKPKRLTLPQFRPIDLSFQLTLKGSHAFFQGTNALLRENLSGGGILYKERD